MRFLRLVLATAFFPLALRAQTLVDLNFTSPVENTDLTNFAGLGNAYSGTTYRFLNVSPGYDLRATITSFGNVRFLGSYPNYSSAAGEPSGDLGYRYEAFGSLGAGGINYQLEFFESGGNFAVPKFMPDFALMIYDVDGEPNQDESVRVFLSDGFYGFRMPAAGGTTFVDEGTSFLFSGPGSNRNEDDPSGAFILYFGNTSNLVLRMLSDTSSGSLPNPVFSAIDGDLSLIGKNFSNFTGFQAVPEPTFSPGFLLAAGAIAGMWRRRWRSLR